MLPVSSFAAFALVALGMAVTPGPNMIYLLSRAIGQGRGAGLISLGGVALGLVFYVVCAALGLTALLLAVPYAYDAVRCGGAVYLLWLAWQAVRPGGRSPFQVRDLPKDGPRRLFLMGLFTSVLNPKIAVLYVSLLPQFVEPARGSVLAQSLALGCLQVAIGVTVNAGIAVSAASVAALLARHPTWAAVQRWLMGAALGGLALRMATETRR